jgi:arylsulfatase A-like enzyme
MQQVTTLIRRILLFSSIPGSVSCISCHKDPAVSKNDSVNVVIVVMDGARFSETFGDPSHTLIPRMGKMMAPHGIVFSKFYNNGSTLTNPGHAALTTGHYQAIDNGGHELPSHASLFQHFLYQTKPDPTKAWIIASKDKLDVLTNCTDTMWKDKFRPSSHCGNGGKGVGSGYRDDNQTLQIALDVFKKHKPRLALIQFMEPDVSGHSGNWQAYQKAVSVTDEYIYQLWRYIESDDHYRGNTYFIVTNDHGRHLDGVSDGFASHGDDCEGCRHIMLYASGPGLKKGTSTGANYEIIDLTVSLASILGLERFSAEGKTIKELLR